jgi:hypothetical protein
MPELPGEARLADFYQKRLAAIEEIYKKGEVRQAREALDEIWPNVEYTFNWCAQRAGSNDVAAVLVTKLAGVAGHLFEGFFSASRAIQWRETGLDAVDRLIESDVLPESSRQYLARDRLGHLTYLGIAHLRNGNLERGRALCEGASRTPTAGASYDQATALRVVNLSAGLPRNSDHVA